MQNALTGIAQRLVSPLPAGALALALLAGCSSAKPPADNGLTWQTKGAGGALASRPVKVGSEGPELPACPSISKVKAPGTTVYWAPDETRVGKATLPAGLPVALCEATPDDRWFGIIFPGPGADGDMATCGVARTVPDPTEYQGPCRSGWIRGGTLTLG